MGGDHGKDFDSIADDYAFFRAHATVEQRDVGVYLEQIEAVRAGESGPPDAPELAILDFGCGSGTFTERLLDRLGQPPERLNLTLVDPADSLRRAAATRLHRFVAVPPAQATALSPDLDRRFDMVLAHHVCYYVDDLTDTLRRLIAALRGNGRLLLALETRASVMRQPVAAAFAALGREVPYYNAADVDDALRTLGVGYRKQPVRYELTFPDSTDNRRRILRFLLADHLAGVPEQPLLDWFDRFSSAGVIRIWPDTAVFVVFGAGIRS